MRRLALGALLVSVALASGSCKRSSKHAFPAGSELLSVLPMDDPNAEAQLVSGFYPLEGGAWRWTAGKFSVILRPPPGAVQSGAHLELGLNLSDVVVRELGAVTLSATAGGVRLPPATYSAPGNQLYSADMPASILAADKVTIDFATDKAIPAGKIEKRELALIVTSVGLSPK